MKSLKQRVQELERQLLDAEVSAVRSLQHRDAVIRENEGLLLDLKYGISISRKCQALSQQISNLNEDKYSLERRLAQATEDKRSLCKRLDQANMEIQLLKTRAKAAVQGMRRLKSDSIDALGLTVRTRNCLAAEDVILISQLVRMTERDLLRLPNIGRRTLNEIKESLQSIGKSLTTK